VIKTKLLNFIRIIFKFYLFEKLLRKLVNGKLPNSIIAKLVPNNYQYPKNSVRIFEYYGVMLKLDISDYLAHYLYFGFKDSSHIKLYTLVKKDNLVLDIGTNFGTTILQFARIIGKDGLAYGFEPDPTNFSICQNNIKLNKFSNIRVENLGVGSKDDTLLLVVDSEYNRGMNKISLENNGKESFFVKIICIDDWVESKNITQVDLIKIDVEGFEMEVLKGAEKTLKTFKPLLFIELDNNNLKLHNSSAKELVEYLMFLGYEILHTETESVILNTADFKNCHYDIICK
jgi:FkbM family methyltransferase